MYAYSFSFLFIFLKGVSVYVLNNYDIDQIKQNLFDSEQL